MLEARKLTKSFGEVRALHSLDVSIGAGEAMCLPGANGAGVEATVLAGERLTVALAGRNLVRLQTRFREA